MYLVDQYKSFFGRASTDCDGKVGLMEGPRRSLRRESESDLWCIPIIIAVPKKCGRSAPEIIHTQSRMDEDCMNFTLAKSDSRFHLRALSS